MRKKLLYILLFISFNAYSQDAFLDDIKGKVEIKRSESESWGPANNGMEVYLSDMLSTGFGASATLKMDNSSVIIKPLSRLTMDMLIKSEKKVTTSLFLQVGAITAEVESSSDVRQNFQVQSPFSTASVRGTKFDYDGKKLEVFDGKVAFIIGKQKRLIQKELLKEKFTEKGLVEEEVTLEELLSIVEEIEDSVSDLFGETDDEDTIYINPGESIEIIINFTPDPGDDTSEIDEIEDIDETSLITDVDDVKANSNVITDTSYVSTKAGSISEEESPEESFSPSDLEQDDESTEITVIWGDEE